MATGDHAHATDDGTSSALHERLVKELTEERLPLPLLPAVASQVLSGTMDEASDAAALATLIQRDQALAAHVLRSVNSPAYRGVDEIVSLQQAVARLGILRIRELALAIALGADVFKPEGYQHLAERSWRDALSVALWAREFARVARRNVELAYLAGLLHNVGHPVLLQRLAQLQPGLNDDAVYYLLDALGGLAGYALAASWDLPDAVTTTIRQLADNQAVDGAEQPDLLAVVQCALLTTRYDLSSLPAQLVGSSGAAFLNLYPEDLEAVLAQHERIETEVEAMQ